jgi:hypothetical protein
MVLWTRDRCEGTDVHLCRECEVVLWRQHQACPACRAQSPAARTGPLLFRTRRTAHEHLAVTVVVAVTAPLALGVVDQVLCWLLAGP